MAAEAPAPPPPGADGAPASAPARPRRGLREIADDTGARALMALADDEFEAPVYRSLAGFLTAGAAHVESSRDETCPP